MSVRKNTSADALERGRVLASRSPRGRNQRKTLPSKQRRGGEEWEGFRSRLSALVTGADGPPAAFAKKCGISPSLLNSWLFGRALPGSIHLSNIAAKSRVSLDWLVDGVGHDGTRSADLIRRGRRRGDAAFARDFAAEVSRHFNARDGGADALAAAVEEIDATAAAAECARRIGALRRRYRLREERVFRREYQRFSAAVDLWLERYPPRSSNPQPSHRPDVQVDFKRWHAFEQLAAIGRKLFTEVKNPRPPIKRNRPAFIGVICAPDGIREARLVSNGIPDAAVLLRRHIGYDLSHLATDAMSRIAMMGLGGVPIVTGPFDFRATKRYVRATETLKGSRAERREEAEQLAREIWPGGYPLPLDAPFSRWRVA